MIRGSVFMLCIALLVWAPWMDTDDAKEHATRALEAFGPVPSACFDAEGELLQDGLVVHWYPMGRMVHTCNGDYVVWMWGAVKEQGGVYKRAEDIHAVQAKALTCEEVLKRQEARRATTTDERLVMFQGTPAKELDISLFPDAEQRMTLLRKALSQGPSFAGKFAVATWECGSNCQNHAVVDVETGRLIAYGLPTEYGVSYTLESSLLVTNPVNQLPPLPDTSYDVETLALNIARLPREYYQLTTDALSGTQYLVRLCVESSAAGYIEIEDERLGLITEDPS